MLWIETEWPILLYNLRMSQRTGVDWASIIQFSLTVFLKYTVPKYRTIIRSALLFVMNTTWTCNSQSDDVFHNDDDDDDHDHHHKYRRWRNSPLIYELIYNIYFAIKFINSFKRYQCIWHQYIPEIIRKLKLFRYYQILPPAR